MDQDSIKPVLDELHQDIQIFLAKEFLHSSIQEALIKKIWLFNSEPFVQGIQPCEFNIKEQQTKFLSVINEFKTQISNYSAAITELKEHVEEIKGISVSSEAEELCTQICQEIEAVQDAEEDKMREKEDRRLEMVKQILYGTQNAQISDSPIQLPKFSEE